MSRFLLSLSFVAVLTCVSAQSIYLRNASFEGEPRDATVPMGWVPCQPGTTPDILPGFWGVYQEPSEGDTYVGLITRPDGSYESITQRLSRSVAPNDCFAFSVDLAHSRTYSGYNQPIKLRIWAGRRKCDRDQLLLETDFIKHSAWRSYVIKFNAEKTVNYLIFEAFYKDSSFSHMGNILIDNCSELRPCPRA